MKYLLCTKCLAILTTTEEQLEMSLNIKDSKRLCTGCRETVKIKECYISEDFIFEKDRITVSFIPYSKGDEKCQKESTPKCKYCGKILKDRKSIKRGCGWNCYLKNVPQPTKKKLLDIKEEENE